MGDQVSWDPACLLNAWFYSLAWLHNTLCTLEGISTAYEKTSSMIMFCHVLMLLEIVHSFLGLVDSNMFRPTVLQVSVAISLVPRHSSQLRLKEESLGTRLNS